TILGIVLNNKNQRVFVVAAVGDLFRDQSNCIVVIRDLELGSVHAQDRVAEVTGVIVHEPDQRKSGQAVFGEFGIELPRPFFEPVVVGECIVETAKINVSEGGQR